MGDNRLLGLLDFSCRSDCFYWISSMKSRASLSVYVLSLFGLILIGIGIYFIFLRPSLLPEDIQFMQLNGTQTEIFRSFAHPWLENVFLVLGGYIMSSGILFLFLAAKPFREFEPWAWCASCLAGLTSIGIMTAVNFKLNSDFKWWLFTLFVMWISALVLNFFESRKSNISSSAAP